MGKEKRKNKSITSGEVSEIVKIDFDTRKSKFNKKIKKAEPPDYVSYIERVLKIFIPYIILVFVIGFPFFLFLNRYNWIEVIATFLFLVVIYILVLIHTGNIDEKTLNGIIELFRNLRGIFPIKQNKHESDKKR